MLSRKHLIVLSLSIATLGLALTPVIQALSPDSDSAVAQTAKKTKAKAKTAKVPSRRTCGNLMYWSAKENKCLDARDKKSTPWRKLD